ncbi:serine protease 23-like [Trichomycterus rosablanca]|uniref:serine protease 23-like n=1 Tax=Trichomycterus rosablanca TaxID=2290929 RepID=UPI002F353FAD
MASLLLPVLFFLLMSVCPALTHKPQWPLQRVPVVLPQQTETRPTPDFLGPAQLEVTSSCSPECHKQAPTPNYWDLRSFLSYETLYSNGQLTETLVGIYGFNPATLQKSPAVQGRSRAKRQIFGHDGRFSIIGRDFLLSYPFSAAVKLSTGCSGTLVGDRHVLTAAHCIHDGKNYVKGAQRLRVGFLKPHQKDPVNNSTSNKMKFQWIRVKRTHVPKGWIKGNANDIGMDYDYALLELKKAHKRKHMKIGVSPPAKQLPGQRVQFSGFDNDRQGQLVYRFCKSGDETYDLLYQHCDAQPGASGSGVYARMWDRRHRRWERKVIGVFSGHQWVDLNNAPQEFNVAVRITPLKYAQICYWIKENYMDCREG